MTNRPLDVLAIGNAIVDVIADADDALIEREGMAKGTMRLIDEAEATRLYAEMGPAREASGGSAANTVAGLAALGLAAPASSASSARTSWARSSRHDIRSLGVEFATPPQAGIGATARCLILVTPDAQRTMNTFLGAAQKLGPDSGRRGGHRARENRLSRRLFVGPGGAARGDAQGDRPGPRGRDQGRLHFVRQLRRRPPPRRPQALDRRGRDRHPVRQ